MILAALLLPVAVVVLVLLVQRFGLPVFLALMAVVAGYGIAADMTFQSIGKAFGLGFVTALEQAGLLVMAGALVGMLAIRQPLRGPMAGVAGVLAGLGGTAAGGLALLQPAGTGFSRTRAFFLNHRRVWFCELAGRARHRRWRDTAARFQQRVTS